MTMIRLLHTADVHLGAKFLSLGDKGAAQREQIRASFKKLISLAIAEDVDVVLIAGDLFDANQQPLIQEPLAGTKPFDRKPISCSHGAWFAEYPWGNRRR